MSRVREDHAVVLLSEAASLTARETLTVLGADGIRADVLAWGGLSIGRFSRWCRRPITVPPPGTDPLGYLSAVAELCSSGEYEAVLATHEQAWLFAAAAVAAALLVRPACAATLAAADRPEQCRREPCRSRRVSCPA